MRYELRTVGIAWFIFAACCTAITDADKFIVVEDVGGGGAASSTGSMSSGSGGSGGATEVRCEDNITALNECVFAQGLWNSCCWPNCGELSCAGAFCATATEREAIAACVACPQTCQGFFDCMSAINCVTIAQ